ncbi:hypothetical protein [Flavobacterium cerinum]|uniref:TerB family tellurite resistance protein n=1 Tax=Flavobacterium cerinum TaxID=2502784 RepID=A0ABY5IUP7_9FLAO|nr:hypothetical protein [Flavobacterium cerinum]UUC45186.1 hypothetical protein NOX80_16365 [Flavobacterium cerinum]
MEAIAFITSLHQTVVNEDLKTYQDILSSDTKKITDKCWLPIVVMYQQFSNEEKENFLNFIRLIEVNTVSHVLGILDGSAYLDANQEEFRLICQSDDEVINGDLQDYFLGLEEDPEAIAEQKK